MKPSQFELVQPSDLAGALTAMQGAGAMALAGGQSLLILLRLRLTAAETLVNVAPLADLSGTRSEDASVVFGAATTHAMIEDGAVPDPSLGLMPHVAAGIAYRAVRNFGTMGGSLALADPAADWPLCLLALDATLLLASQTGTRRLAMDDFLETAFTTRLAPGEIITGIEVPRLPAGSRWGYRKLARKHGAFADSLAVAVQPAGGAMRIALGATSRRAVLLRGAMAGDGAVSDDVLMADIAAADPDADDYKRRCHLATVRRAVSQMRGA